jgi:hypothetical protein
VCGSSSGSVIASLYAGGLDPHSTLPELLLRLKRSDILSPWWQRPGVGVYRINQAFLEQNAPVKRLEEGRLPCSVSTFDLRARRTVTHTAGDVATLIAASCAVPGIMQPVFVNGRLHVDGGVADLLGLASCAPAERVLSIDLHTQGLMRMRSLHVALLGTRPGSGAVWRWGARLFRGKDDAGADAAEPVAGAAEAAVPSTSRLAPPLPPILQGCARLQLRGLPFVGPRSVRSRVMDIAALLRVLTQAPCSLRFRRWNAARWRWRRGARRCARRWRPAACGAASASCPSQCRRRTQCRSRR